MSVGRHALDEITSVSSRRAYQRLRRIDDCLAVYQTADVEPDSDRTESSTTYGYDITAWTLIRDLSELHSLASYICRAATKRVARDELHRRIVFTHHRRPQRGVAQRVRLSVGGGGWPVLVAHTGGLGE